MSGSWETPTSNISAKTHISSLAAKVTTTRNACVHHLIADLCQVTDPYVAHHAARFQALTNDRGEQCSNRLVQVGAKICGRNSHTFMKTVKSRLYVFHTIFEICCARTEQLWLSEDPKIAILAIYLGCSFIIYKLWCDVTARLLAR